MKNELTNLNEAKECIKEMKAYIILTYGRWSKEYEELNEIMDYLEDHLEEEIQAKDVAKRIGLNEYTFLRIFSIICGTTFSEYVRNRRLSNAGQEIFLNGGKIVDIAIKYQYNNATAFSRAFERFHGIKPSQVKDNPEKLKLVAKMHFNEDNECKQDIDYKIIERKEIVLYGIYKETTNERIKQDAPEFYIECQNKFGMAPYALI